jgi:hypothetical protein
MRIDKAIVQQEMANGKMCFKCDHCSMIVFLLVVSNVHGLTKFLGCGMLTR